MRAFKYLAGLFVVIVALAAGAWYLRNSLIQQFSTPILEEYGFKLVDISFDALDSRVAKLSYVELLHTQGTRIRIEGLTLPITTRSGLAKRFQADRVTVASEDRDESELLEIASLVEQFVSLAQTLPGNELLVRALHYESFPVVRNLSWRLDSDEQTLTGTIDPISVSIELERADEKRHSILFSVLNADGTTRSSIISQLTIEDEAILLTGNSDIDLTHWLELAGMVGILPAEVGIESGTAAIVADATIPRDPLLSPAAKVTMTPLSGWEISYTHEDNQATHVSLVSTVPIEINSTFPDVDWTVSGTDARVVVTSGEWINVPLSVQGLSCKIGPECEFQIMAAWAGAKTPLGNADRITASTFLHATFPDEGVRIDLARESSIEVTNLVTAGGLVKAFTAQLAEPGTMQYTSEGWNFSTASIDADVRSVELTEDLSLSAKMFLENVSASESEQAISVDTGIFVPSVSLANSGQPFAAPGLKGRTSLRNDTISFDLQTVGLFQNGTVKGKHNVELGRGAVSIANARMNYAGRTYSIPVKRWFPDSQIQSGIIDITLDADWNAQNPNNAFKGHGSIGLAGLSGFYSEIVFGDLSTGLEAQYSSAAGLTLQPLTVKVALLDVGLPVENLQAALKVDLNNLSADVSELQMSAFGGLVEADPFSFHTAREVNNITLTASRLDLAKMLTIEEFEAVNVTGSIGAILPLTIESDGLSIAGGTLTGVAPGGVIRYVPAAAGGQVTQASLLGMATTALSNFQYETLTSDVNYSKDGNLKLQMQIKGRNPDMEGGRPIVLNLGVENNVVQMLKSLQAARAVEDILERRVRE